MEADESWLVNAEGIDDEATEFSRLLVPTANESSSISIPDAVADAEDETPGWPKDEAEDDCTWSWGETAATMATGFPQTVWV